MKKPLALILFLFLGAIFLFFLIKKGIFSSTLIIPEVPQTSDPQNPANPPPTISQPSEDELEATRKKLMAQLETKEASHRTLEISMESERGDSLAVSFASATPRALADPNQKRRAEGRKRRAAWDMAVVLWDGIPVYQKASGDKVLYTLQTGDFVRVNPERSGGGRLHVYPGLDVYLAATSRDVRPSGEHLPDAGGWIETDKLQIFEPEQAKEFTEGVEPITLGHDASFSTLAFYERAMKNTDITVHRVIGPRLISILGVHEDYVSSWGSLYRDYDPRIRSVTLAMLRERGVGSNRALMEDLIARLSELTQTRAQGETLAEVLAIIDILKATEHPRVPAALQSYLEAWKGRQSEAVIEAAADVIQKLSPPQEKRKKK